MHRKWTLSLIITAVMLAGCQTLASDKEKNQLTDRLKRYETTLRWGYYHQLGGFLKTAQPLADEKNLNEVKIIRYEMIEPPIIFEKNQAVQKIRLSYLRQDEQVVRTFVDHQQWQFNEDIEQWQLTSSLPPCLLQ